MGIEINAGDLILAAFSKALADTGPDEIARVLVETLNAKADSRSWAGNTETVLDTIVRGAVDRLAREVVNDVVASYRPQIESQIRASLVGQSVDVTLDSGYDRKGISVSVVLGGADAEATS